MKIKYILCLAIALLLSTAVFALYGPTTHPLKSHAEQKKDQSVAQPKAASEEEEEE